MRDVKITVLETTFNKKLAEQYGVSGLSTCSYNKVGQEYLSVGGLKPEDLCNDGLRPVVFKLEAVEK